MMNVTQINPVMGNKRVCFAGKVQKKSYDPEEVVQELSSIFESRLPGIQIILSRVSTAINGSKFLYFHLSDYKSEELARRVLRKLPGHHKINPFPEHSKKKYDAYKGYYVHIFGNRTR